MGSTKFHPFGNKTVTVEFDCNNCKTCVKSEEIEVPYPNYRAKKASDSYSVIDGYAVCENCGKNFDVYVYAGYADGYVEVNDIDDDSILVHEIGEDYSEYIEDDFSGYIGDDFVEYYEEQIDAILNGASYYGYFVEEIGKLTELNNIDLEKEELQETLRKQIFSGAITCLEDYLSTTLIQHVLNNEEYFKQFVKTFRDIKNRKFDLSEIYDKLDTIRDIVKKELVDVIYHDLRKVQGMYLDTLGIKFPAIGDLMSLIKTRHDMVHRNGKNRDGVKIEITKELANDVIRKVELFVKDIDEKIAIEVRKTVIHPAQ